MTVTMTPLLYAVWESRKVHRTLSLFVSLLTFIYLVTYLQLRASMQSISSSLRDLDARSSALSLPNSRSLLQTIRQASSHTLASPRGIGSAPALSATNTTATTTTVPLSPNVLVVIASDRVEGIIPVIASILRSTQSTGVDVVLIGTQPDVNQRVREHFGARLDSFQSWTMDEITRDLQTHAHIQPIWTWDAWHSSIRTATWNRLDATIRPDAWDHRAVHAHELNHVRFYLPHLSWCRDRDSLYLVDDDIVVQSDLGLMSDATLPHVSPHQGLVTACNLWQWNDQCHVFDFSLEQDTIAHSTPIYGDRTVCATDTSTNCVPASYPAFVDSFLSRNYGRTNEDPSHQLAWNFGFSLFVLDHWRELRLTDRYEAVMKESYRQHVYPETSLAFGLGVAYLALAGAVQCWNDTTVMVRDGFGFVDYTRMQDTFGDDFLGDMDVIHYTGSVKPWSAYSTIHAQSLQPWLDILRDEQLPIPPQHPVQPTDQLFALVGSPHAQTDALLSVLDRDPHICASGESDMPEIGFPARILDPAGIHWYPTCSIKKGCTYAFVRDSVRDLTRTATPARCHTFHPNEALDRHWKPMCNFVAALQGNYTDAEIARVWVEAYQREDKNLLRCACKRGALVKGLAIAPEWLMYQGYPHERVGPAALELNATNLVGRKMIRLKRRHLWPHVKGRLLDEATQVWNPQTSHDRAAQIRQLEGGEFHIDAATLQQRLHEARHVDVAGDAWTNDHASTILWLYYEDCRQNTAECIEKIGHFLEIDVSALVSNAELLETMFSTADVDDSLDHVRNKEEILDVLRSFSGASSISAVS